MKKVGIFLFVFLFTLLFPQERLHAEDSLTATLDRSEISLGETATLVLSLKVEEAFEEVSLPIIPSVPGLLIFYRQTRQVLSPQAGKVSKATEFVYTLFPETAGTKVIPSLRMHLGDRLLLTKPLTLKVVQEIAPSQKGGPDETFNVPQKETMLFPGETRGQPPKAFARVVVDRSRPFVNELVKVTLWAYATVPFQYQGLKNDPRSEGWAQLKSVEGEFVSQEGTETREGETYRGRSLEEQIWFPNQSGKSVLDIGEIPLLLKSEAGNLFDRSFQEELPAGPFGSRAEPVTLKLDPVSFDVRPLPEKNKPEDFSGAVGHFTVSSSIDETDLEIGQSATWRLQIRGEGNLVPMKDPFFKPLPFATSFRPRSFDHIRREKRTVISDKTYEIILITNREGDYPIDPFSFSYFNPRFHAYRRATAGSLALTIHKTKETASSTSLEREKREPELLGEDIYYLKKEIGDLYSETPSFLTRPIFWGIQCIPLFVLGLAVFWRSYQRYLKRNIAVIRRRKAFQTAKRHLKVAEAYLDQKRLQDFAREAQEAIVGYLSDKTGLAKGSLTIDRIVSMIRSRGAKHEVEKNVGVCLETLQAVQFASAQKLEIEPKEGLALSKEVLRELEELDLSEGV